MTAATKVSRKVSDMALSLDSKIRWRFLKKKKQLGDLLPSGLLPPKTDFSTKDRASVHTSPRVVPTEERRAPSASQQLLPVLPFRRIRLPSRSPLTGTTTILYSVPGCRPGDKWPVLDVSAASHPSVGHCAPWGFSVGGRAEGLCFSPNYKSI